MSQKAEPLPPAVRRLVGPYIIWAQREDGHPSANDPAAYVLLRAGGPSGEDVVWGPGGVLVHSGDADDPDPWIWADDLDCSEDYYTPEYRLMFPSS